jgi:glyoxylase-like metal-dependent hydrolase (beta-lactamase superfamily II)
MPRPHVPPHIPTTLLVRVGAGALALAGVWFSYAQNAATQTPPAGPQLALQKIKDDLYVIAMAQGVGGGNVAVYLTDEGVILVDDMFDRNFTEIMGKVKSITAQPIKYVLNTHQHDDHAGGNAQMLPFAQVIAHRNVRANMVRLNQPGLPRITFTDEMDVFLGGKEVRALYFGRGHTGGDAVIYFPALKVIHTGDLFLTFPTQPFIDYANGGSALDWTKTLDGVQRLDFDIAIPGHGPVSDRAGLQKFRANFETMRSRISSMAHGGKDKAEISKTLSSDFGWAPGGLALQQVDAFIAELK